MFLAFNMACTSEGQNAANNESKENVEAKAKDLTSKVDPEILSLLDVIKNNPNDHNGNAEKLNKVAKAFVEAKKTRQGVSLLNQALKSHYSAPNTADNAFDLMNIYNEHYKGTNNASIMALALKRAFPKFPKMDQVSALIPAGSKTLEGIIDETRLNMTDKETGRLDLKQANKFITTSEIFAMMLPKEGKTPSFLQKAGEVARSIKAYPKSIEIYDWIMKSHPAAPEAAQALFMKAFTYDNELKDKAKAKALYQEFLKKHPKDGFADDTQFLLDNIDKSNEDIIKGFGEKKK